MGSHGLSCDRRRRTVLAFLGLGLETGTAEWGAMFVNANKLMFSHPELLVYPGLCILFAAAGFNLFGEALRDLCAPKEGS